MRAILSVLVSSVALATLAVGAGCTTTVIAAKDGAEGAEDASAGQGTLASVVSFGQVSINQAVKIALLSDDVVIADEERNGPVIAGRPAVVRAFLTPLGAERPEVDGELTVSQPGKADVVLRSDGKRTTPLQNEESTATQFSFSVAAEDIGPDTTLKLRVARAGEDMAGEDVLESKAIALQSKTTSHTVRVKFVPISMDDAGVAQTPDVDLDYYRDAVYRLYPVSNVEVSTRNTFRWTKTVQSNGQGWSDLLSSLIELRRNDAAPSDVYYIGLLTPKSSFSEFCARGGCVLGLAPQANVLQVGLRAALVLGYRNRSTEGTLSHELAHAMGRGHAPCGSPDAADSDYPYPQAALGVWGYDVVDDEWLNPSRSRDVMSYCSPTWISDYTYRALFERMDQVARQVGGGVDGEATPSAMKSFRIAADGSVTEGPLVDVLPGASTDDDEIAYETAGGHVVSRVRGITAPLTETGERFVLAPPPPREAVFARVTSANLTRVRLQAPKLARP